MSMMKDLEGRLMVVTGANTGIGRVAAKELAGRGAEVVLACRSEDKTRPVIDEILAAGGKARFVALDLSDFSSVRAAADGLLADARPIDVLLNNAGLAGTRGLTKDGFELTFGTNHLGHFLLTMRLMPLLAKAPAARVVSVASKAHAGPTTIDFEAVRRPTQTVSGVPEYGVSKLANVLFTRELGRRLGDSPMKTIRTYSLHPGVVASDVWRRVPWPVRGLMKLFMITNEQGARTSVYCATSPEVAGQTGRYYDLCREKTPSPTAQDDGLAKRLWEKSVEYTGADLP